MGGRFQHLMLAIGGMALAVFAVCGKLHADTMVAQRPEPIALRGPVAPAEPVEPAIRIRSEPCWLTSGIDAALYTTAAADTDSDAQAERLAAVRQCAVDAIVAVKALSSPQQVSEDEVLELLSGLVTYYPSSSNDLGIANLQMRLHLLLEDYVNRR